MSLETDLTITVALIPFLAVWGLLALARNIEGGRERRVARQIALTDAIHRELGAAAAPDVRRGITGEWIVSVRLPLQREATVGAVTRLAYELFRRLDREDPPRLRVVLMPPEARPGLGSSVSDFRRPVGGLRRAA
jgi:hypothetical protein